MVVELPPGWGILSEPQAPKETLGSKCVALREAIYERWPDFPRGLTFAQVRQELQVRLSCPVPDEDARAFIDRWLPVIRGEK